MTKPKPLPLAMVICDSVIEDRITRKKSLIGIFNNITAVKAPCVHPKLNVFVSLTNGHGKYKMKLCCSNETNQKEILSMDGDVDFKNPRQIVEFNCEIAGLNFPEFGDYTFSVLFDGNPIISRRFKITQKEN